MQHWRKTKTAGCLIACLTVLVYAASAEWIPFSVDELIPDNDPSGVQDTQTLSGFENNILSVKVRLRIDPADGQLAYNGDYYAYLQHDSGFSVLLNRVGKTSVNPLGYDNNGFNIILETGNTDVHVYQESTIPVGTNALSGTWSVDGRNVDPSVVLDTTPRTATLAAFNGLDPNGDWTVFVADLSENGEGKLVSWGIDVEVVPEPGVLGLFVIGLFGTYGLIRMWETRRKNKK